MPITFDPTINLWRDSDTGLTGATQKDAQEAVARQGAGISSAKSLSFAPLTRAYGSFSLTRRSGSTFEPNPNLDKRFGGNQ